MTKSGKMMWVLTALASGVGCRLGYDEVLAIDAGAGAGIGSGGSAGTDTGGASGAGRGGSGPGGTSGGTLGPGGEGGEPSTGGSALTGGAAGTNATGGKGGASGATGGTMSGGSGGSGGGGGSGGSAGAPDPALCNNGTFGGHDYLLCKEERSWAAAVSGCVTAGMRLVRIDDEAEDQWLFDNAFVENGVSSVWIGATDQAVEGEWRWTDGDLFWIGNYAGTVQNGLYAGWYHREPNDVAMAEDCATLVTNSSTPDWFDDRCELAYPFICESL